MVDYKYSDLYKQDSVDKQLNIAFDGGNITNTDIHSEQFELTESLCSESELRFGSCEASMIKFRISNVFTPLKDKWLTVTETLNHNTDTPFKFGKYKVYSDVPMADRRYRDVVAYDKMYEIINVDLTEWYNSLFPTDDTEMTLKEFRDRLMNYLGVEQEDVALVNDDMVVKKTIQPTQLSGKDVVSAICEINGCFGHIGRDGKFHYVFLPKYAQGLYPANDLYPADDLYPRESSANAIEQSLFISCKYEDYLSQRITKLQIRQEENDIGTIYPGGTFTEEDNTYIVQNNFLVYGKSASELNEIAHNLYGIISGTEYRPFNASVVGNPCFEVGDAIRFNTKYKIVESYILNRTLTGVQGLRDSFSADGEEYYTEKVNAFETQIAQLKGKTNILERSVEETRSEIKDVEKDLKTEITQTSESVSSEITRAKESEEELSSRIEQTISSIELTINNGDKTAGIVITLESEDGSKRKVAGKIEMTGMVTFNDLKNKGSTVINGSNITTGTIDASKVNVENIDATNIKTGTLSAIKIESSILEGTIYADWKSGRDVAILQYTGGMNSSDYLQLGNPNVPVYIPCALSVNGYNPIYNAGSDIYAIGSMQLLSSESEGMYIHCITGSGAYGITIWASDTKLKKNINPTEETALDKVKQIEFVQFDWKSDNSHVDLGVSANQLEDVIPHAVYEVEQPEESEYSSLKNIDNSIMTTYALKAIQEQQKIIENQQKEIDELKKSVSFLMQKIGGADNE